jgi:predicted protein tyrosine phosphatase
LLPNSSEVPGVWTSELQSKPEKAVELLTLNKRAVILARDFWPRYGMFIEEIGRHLSVSSIPELEQSLKLDKAFWSVISIREPQVSKPAFLSMAKRYHVVICEDREEADPNFPSRPPRAEDVQGIFQFVDAYPGEPILVHCLAGLSRSPAVALALIVRGMFNAGWDFNMPTPLVDRAISLLIQIRRKARPNMLFLRLCLERFLPAKEAEDLTMALVNHPTLMENRLAKPPGSHGAYRLGD